MVIGGLQKISLLDYPGQVSAIIFTQGCNFRCHFCYNPMLVWPKKVGKVENKEGDQTQNIIKEDDLLSFLQTRKNKLDAVVITGGEPTLHKDLPDFIKKIRQMGFLIKLDTNGTNPEMLKKLLSRNLLDYIASDFKAPLKRYEEVVSSPVDVEKISQSVKIIMESGLPYEFRTTLVSELLDKEDIKKMGEYIQGAEKWYLQKFQPAPELVDQNFTKAKPYTDKQMQEIKEIASAYVKVCGVR